MHKVMLTLTLFMRKKNKEVRGKKEKNLKGWREERKKEGTEGGGEKEQVA